MAEASSSANHAGQMSAVSLLSTQWIPEDCILHILKMLGPEQLSMLATVSKELNSLASQDVFWQALCYKSFTKDLGKFPEHYLHDETKPELGPNWKRVYRAVGDAELELHFVAGPRLGQRQVVGLLGTSVGRSRSNDVCILHDEMVSRKHARLVHHLRRFWIHDVGGINGTCLNGDCIAQHVDVLLRFGDVVDLGASSFIVKMRMPGDDVEKMLTARNP